METINERHTKQFDEQLDLFLKGRMSSDEEYEFKKLLTENPQLRQKAIATAQLAKAMNIVGYTADQTVIDEIKSSSQHEIQKIAEAACSKDKRKARVLRKLVVSLSVAASIILCVFGAYKYYQYERISSLGLEYLSYFPDSDFIRGGNDTISEKIQALSNDIENKKNIDSAIEELSGLWQKSQEEIYNDYTDYMPVLGWLLANAYLINNNRTQALEIINKLIFDFPEDTAIGQKARELKNRIEKI